MGVFARSTVTLEGIGDVVITTMDFSQPGYEVCGFETTTTLPDGREFGVGPDNGESPAELHAECSDPAEVARAVKEMWRS